MADAAKFARWIADLLAQSNPAPGTMAADLQSAARNDGITRAGRERLIEQLRATPPDTAREEGE